MRTTATEGKLHFAFCFVNKLHLDTVSALNVLCIWNAFQWNKWKRGKESVKRMPLKMRFNALGSVIRTFKQWCEAKQCNARWRRPVCRQSGRNAQHREQNKDSRSTILRFTVCSSVAAKRIRVHLQWSRCSAIRVLYNMRMDCVDRISIHHIICSLLRRCVRTANALPIS